MTIFKEGYAKTVVFYPRSLPPSAVQGAYVTVYDNGMVHVKSEMEETMGSIQNCDIVWTHAYPDLDEETLRPIFTLHKGAEGEDDGGPNAG